MLKNMAAALIASALLVCSTPAIADPPADIVILGCIPAETVYDQQHQYWIIEYQVLFPEVDRGELCASNLEAYIQSGFQFFAIQPAGETFFGASDFAITVYHLRRNRGGLD